VTVGTTTSEGPPRQARALVAGLGLLAGAATVASALTGGHAPLEVALLVAAAALCAIAGAFEVRAPGDHALQPNLVFFFAGAVLLPAAWVPLLAVLCFLPSLILRRGHPWAHAFNVAVYVLAGLTADAVVRLVDPVHPYTFGDAPGAVSLLLAGAAFVAVNHLALALVMAASGQQRLLPALRALASTVPLDLALVGTGAALAVLWHAHPLLTALAAGPLLVVHRALHVPTLQHRSRTDPKTGLFHFAHFEGELTEALRLARRREEPLAVLMVDLDHLRRINNRFGHMAGDRAIRQVAAALLAAAGERGVAARFGGEEFCLMVPGLEARAARRLGERLRRDVEMGTWREDGESVDPSVSIGIACHPQHGDDAATLLRVADGALYEAKLGGRNRVRVALTAAAADTLEEGLDHAAPRSSDPPPVVPLRAPAPALTTAEDPPPAEAAEPESEPAEPSGPPAPTRRLVPYYVAALLGATAAIVALTGAADATAAPVYLAILVAAVVGIDAIRIDLFERANTSPASVPTLMLAFLFGPVGPVVGELAIALVRALRREPTIRWTFDLGALSLAGATAAIVFAALPGEGALAVVLAGPVAALAYYAVNMLLLSVVMSLAEGVRLARVWRERLAWLWPHYLIFGALAAGAVALERDIGWITALVFGLPVLSHWLAQKQYVDRSRSSVRELRESHDDLTRANLELKRLLDEKRDLLRDMQRSYVSTITSLARTIEAKDPYTGGHTERVARVALLLARELDLHPDQLRAVEVGAIIHDIGKVGVPDHVLLKPGRLDEGEFAVMRRHPEISSYIVGELELPAIVKQMVRSHHERFDGRGYPDRLVGEEIPLVARILSVADTLDAMTSDRPYRGALPLAEALAEIRQERGRQFCPRVVDALDACLERDTTLDGLRGAPGMLVGQPAA
jgi:diguanylate cyclase (GGDEF)-like protein